MANDYPDAGAPAPPPPPPLALGAVPAVRLKSEIPERRAEPPACVQNAMMTKDKKPFTYTPGGIDLSQIRSPRMARRITRNANAEGVPDVARPAGAPQQHGPLPPSALAAMQPQLPVQVFPAGGGPPAPPPPPPPPPGPGAGPAPTMAHQPPAPPTAKAPSPPNSNSQMPYVRPDIKIPENPMGLLRKTGGPHRTQPDTFQSAPPPPQPQPVQAAQPQPARQQPVYKSVQPPVPSPVQTPVQPVPQPVYQPRPPVAVSPEQRHESRQQVGSIYIPPLNSEEMNKSPPAQKCVPESPGSPMDTLKKAPTPWLTGRVQPPKQEPPAWARSPPESTASSTPSTPATPATPGTPGTRVIPIRVERTDDSKDINQQQMHQTQQMYQQQQQQRQQQYQQQMQQQMMQQYRQQQQQFQQQQHHQQQQQQQQQQQYQQQPTHVVRMIPIQIEGQMTHVGPMSPSGNMGTPDITGAPVQSPTFRVLQRVTSRDEELHSQPAIHHPPSLGHAFPVEQMRKMQLTEEEKALMARMKNQVDEDCFLHDEVDPRYRGPAIPSRAFRMLQSMTDAAEASGDPTCVPRAVIVHRGPHPQGGIRKPNSPRTPDGEGALPPSEQKVQEPRKYTGSAIPSRTFQALQAMVAPENCANGSETDETNASYPYDPSMYPWGYNPVYPPPPYWNDPYWGYYPDPSAYPAETEALPPGEDGGQPRPAESVAEPNGETPAMSPEEYYAQMAYWDPYYAYYGPYFGYYPPPHPYSPHAFYPSNETDDYSSTDEMAYYGARFPRGPTPCGHVSVPLAPDQVTPTDTEVEEISSESEYAQGKGGLQAIKSVSDIQVYNENTHADETSATEEESSASDDDEADEDEEEDSDSTEDGAEDSDHLPHQLSVILEESEVSDVERRRRETSVATTASEDDSSTTIGGEPGEDDSCDEQDIEEATVTVRLPLKLKFGVSENGKEGVTELIVGDSELQHHTPDTSVSVSLNANSNSEHKEPAKGAAGQRPMRSPFCRQNSDETTENYETAEDTDAHDNSPVQSGDEYEEGDTDFWDEIQKKVKSEDEADSKVDVAGGKAARARSEAVNESDTDKARRAEPTQTKQTDTPDDDENRAGEDEKVKEEDVEEEEEEDEDDDEDDDSSESDENSDNEETDDCKLEKDLRDAFASDAVKDCVRRLWEAGKAHVGDEPKEEAVSVRQRILAIENGGTGTSATSASRSSSMKGCDFSEEDGDSGVTSDVSRHTDTESDYFAEQLRKRYQRASTHSRLFKLLQDECSKSDDEDDDDDEEANGDGKDVELRRKKLSLPLSGSEPESGICSPSSPTWLARELVHGLLGGRRGRKYKSLPLERLYAAAQRILQADALSCTSEDGSPGDSYAADYRSYYSTWEEAGSRCSSAMRKRIARCPRVKSEKNVPACVTEEEDTVAEVGVPGETSDPCPNHSTRPEPSSSPCRPVSRQQVPSAS